MSTHCEFYGWSVKGDKVTITFQAWKEFLGMTTAQCFIRYDGKKQDDGTIFWIQDDGAVVSESMERKLNHIHKQYSIKHGIAA